VEDRGYEVRLEGAPTGSWPEWFPGVRMERENRPDGSVCTLLLVPGMDVSRLHGVLAQIGGLNLRLVSVNRAPRSAT
jgi:hypothetical protein